MKSFCVIGLSKFGTALALTLAGEGKQVAVIDPDAERVRTVADTVTHAVIGDPTNDSVLRSAAVKEYDCVVVAFSDNINDNILLTIMLKEIGVKYIVVRALNEGHRKVLERIGADKIVFPERDTGERLAITLGRDNVTDYMEFNGFSLAEIIVPERWLGKNLMQLEIRKKYAVNVIAVTFPNGKVDVSPSPTRNFEKGERITVVGSDAAIAKCMKTID